MNYHRGIMRFELKGFSLENKLATWIDYSHANPIAMARAKQAELQRQRSQQAEQERERSSRERDDRLRRQQQAFVPLPVLQAFAAAGLGDYRTMDKAAIIACLAKRQRLAKANQAQPLPPILAAYLSQNAT